MKIGSTFFLSHETKINEFESDGVQHVWCGPGQNYHSDCIVWTVRHVGGSMLIWSCISAEGEEKSLSQEGWQERNFTTWQWLKTRCKNHIREEKKWKLLLGLVCPLIWIQQNTLTDVEQQTPPVKSSWTESSVKKWQNISPQIKTGISSEIKVGMQNIRQLQNVASLMKGVLTFVSLHSWMWTFHLSLIKHFVCQVNWLNSSRGIKSIKCIK